MSPARRWRKRLLLACLAPALLCATLAAIEFALRASGTGTPTAFFLPDTHDDLPVWRDNPDATRVDFGARLARAPAPFMFRRNKPPGAFRIFVLGGSAAAGDPEPAFSFSRQLAAELEATDPPRAVEVINPSITAVNSHVLRRMMREIRNLEPDVVVLYLGHNEVVGPFGPGSLFGHFTPSRADIAFRTFVRRSRIAQALEPFLPAARTPESWQGMAMFLDRRISADDPRLETVYRHFAGNLSDMVRDALSAGARVILCTAASNLRDCAPFASIEGPDATPQETESIEALRQALQQAPASAALHHRLGLALESTDPTAAREAFMAARDLDALRFRADRRINRIIREVAASAPSNQVMLLDLEQTIAQLPFPEQDAYFLDHVHFTYEGNRLVAAQLLQALRALYPDLAGPASAQPGQLDAALAWNEWSEWRVVREMSRRREKPPFTLQSNHAEDARRWAERLAGASGHAGGVHEQFNRAIERRPADWFLLHAFGEFLIDRAEYADAQELLRRAIERMPHRTESESRLALALAGSGKLPELEARVRRTARTSDEVARTFERIGIELGERGSTAEAVEVLQRALVLAPSDAAIQNALGGALLIAGRTDEAARSLRGALSLDPELPDAHNNLGSALAQSGRLEEALPHFREAVRLVPTHASARRNFLQAAHLTARQLAGAGHAAEAAARLKEAVAVEASYLPALADLAVLYSTTAVASPENAQEALRWAQAALDARDPADPRAWAAMAAAMEFANRRVEAEDAANAALAQIPLAGQYAWRTYLKGLRGAAAARRTAPEGQEPGAPPPFSPE